MTRAQDFQMNWCILFLSFASIFVDAAKRKLDSGNASEEPSQKIQRLNQEDATGVQESGLYILDDLIPLFLHFSDHQLAHSLSQVNHACFKAVCFSSFEVINMMPRLSVPPNLATQRMKIILNFTFQHLMNTEDITSRPDKLSALLRILAGLDNKTISMAVTAMLKAMNLNKFEINALYQTLTSVHIYRENNGPPTPYLTVYAKILLGGFESFSEQINIEIVRMFTHRVNPELPAYVKNTEIYHKFFQDMLLMFPEFCAQKYQELLDTEASSLLIGFSTECAKVFRDIMGPYADLVTPALDTEPITTKMKANNFDYLWKLILNTLVFLQWSNQVQINPQEDQFDPELLAETNHHLFKLVAALKTSDAFSLEGLSDIKIFRFVNYVGHSLQTNRTTEYILSIAAKVVNSKDIVTSFHFNSALLLTGYNRFIYQLMEEKISALPSGECVFEHLKFVGPSTIASFSRYHKFKNLPYSLDSLIQSNLRCIALGDKEMAGKYDAVLSFMAESFPKSVNIMAAFIVSAALSDKFLSEEKNLFFIFDEIPGMTTSLRKKYDILISMRKVRTE